MDVGVSAWGAMGPDASFYRQYVQAGNQVHAAWNTKKTVDERDSHATKGGRKTEEEHQAVGQESVDSNFKVIG